MPPELLKALSELMRNGKTAIFGNVLSRLQVVVDHNFEALAAVRSDGCLIYNPSHQWAAGLSIAKLKHVLIHEASHILLKHLHRVTPEMAKDANTMRSFNIAADMALEHLIASVSTDFLPEHHAGLEQFVPKSNWGKTMEQLVDLIDPNHPAFGKQPLDLSHLTPAGRKAVQDAIDKSVSKAVDKLGNKKAGQGRGTTNNTSTLLSRILAQYTNIDARILQPLKEHFQIVFGSDTDRGTPGLLSQRKLLRREFMGLPMLGRNMGAQASIPRNKEQWHNDVTLLMDVSGSVNHDSLQACLRFIQRLTAQHNVFPVRVLTFNSTLQQEFTMLDSTSIESIASAIRIGGGTNIRTALVDSQSTSKLTIVFTDMDCTPVTLEQFNTGTKVVFVAYDYRKHTADLFEQFTAGDCVDGNAMVDLFR